MSDLMYFFAFQCKNNLIQDSTSKQEKKDQLNQKQKKTLVISIGFLIKALSQENKNPHSKARSKPQIRVRKKFYLPVVGYTKISLSIEINLFPVFL